MRTDWKGLLLVSIFGIFSLVASMAWSASSTDPFIRGYVTAVLEREFLIRPSSIEVHNGSVVITSERISRREKESISAAIADIEGVNDVRIVTDNERQDAGIGISGEVPGDEDADVADAASWNRPAGRKLFFPLLADPLWPHFSISYNIFTDEGLLKNALGASAGETLPLYRDYHPLVGQWQIAFQGMATTINDLDSDSWDLINADYIFGVSFLNRKGTLSSLFSIKHFSSHAGDELILNRNADRINLSYEKVDFILSKDISRRYRIYGGGEYRFSRNPEELEPWALRYGFEWRSGRKYFDAVEPLAAFNIYHQQERDWSGAVSLRLGVELAGYSDLGHSLMILLGYFNGPSHYGQFYRESDEYVNLGIHYYF